jgi:hypothetical protein
MGQSTSATSSPEDAVRRADHTASPWLDLAEGWLRLDRLSRNGGRVGFLPLGFPPQGAGPVGTPVRPFLASQESLPPPSSAALRPASGCVDKNYWFMGWVLQRKITDNLALGVELFHQTPSQIGGLPSTGINFGGIYDFTDHYHFLFSVGKGLEHAKETNELSWYIGLQVTGGEEPRKAQEAAP